MCPACTQVEHASGRGQGQLGIGDRAAVAFQIVLTKADDVPPAQFAKRLAEVEALARRHTAAHPMVMVTSSETGQGIPELRAELSAFAVPL